jgi:hypothetical protein
LSRQIFLSFFSKEYKRKKVVKVGKGTKRKHGTDAIIVEVQTVIDDIVMQEGDELNPEEEEIANALRGEELETPADNGQQIHDEKVVQTLKVRAIADMARRGVKITPAENKAAIGISPKVCPLIR